LPALNIIPNNKNGLYELTGIFREQIGDLIQQLFEFSLFFGKEVRENDKFIGEFGDKSL
jgi:hypothetical protein